MKFVTFNIRTEAACDGVNRFFNRKGFIVDKIEREMPDIIGFQEMRPEMHEYMRKHLASIGYALLGCGREKDLTGEHNPIAYLSDKYEPIALDVSWLSDTPYVPGSRYEAQSICPRIITHMILKPINENAPFHVYNTHLDHQEKFARIEGAKRVIEKIREDSLTHPLPLILSGDFNAYPESEEAMLIANSDLGLTELTNGIGNTWHNWGKSSDPQIDYIFAKGFTQTGAAKKWDDKLGELYLSDHYPIEVEILRD